MSLGKCCGCGSYENVRNILALDERAPVPGTGWGCVVCDLQADGAVAVMCDKCWSGKVEPKWACVGYPGKDQRVAIDQLRGTFAHDTFKHMAYEERVAKRRSRPLPVTILLG